MCSPTMKALNVIAFITLDVPEPSSPGTQEPAGILDILRGCNDTYNSSKYQAGALNPKP